MWFALLQHLVVRLQHCLNLWSSAALHWRDVEIDGVQARMRVLRDGGKSYLGALRKFDRYLCQRGWVLSTAQSVDHAVFYYVKDLRRAQAEILLSALFRAYPALRGCLGASSAIVADMSVTQPTHHHPPMPWGMALMLAETIRFLGYPRRALALLLQWRCGLRPGEVLQFRGGDISFDPCGVSVLRLGLRRGTKTRRRAAVRIRGDDWRTQTIFAKILATVAVGEPLCDWKRTVDITRTLGVASAKLGWPAVFTAHCPRAGWATALWVAGTPFSELQEMGRWGSAASLRIYLDFVAASDMLDRPPFCNYHQSMSLLDATFSYRWA